MAMKLPLSAQELIPHRGHLLQLSELTSYNSRVSTGLARVTKENIFLAGAPYLLTSGIIEILAQQAAATGSYRHQNSEGKGALYGFLVGIDEFTLLAPVRSVCELGVTLEIELEIGALSVVKGELLQGNESVAKGQLRLWEGSEELFDPIKMKAKLNQPPRGSMPQGPERREVSLVRELAALIKSHKPRYEDNELELELSFPARFIGFDGHFPEGKLLPGAILLETGVAICAQSLKRHLRLRRVRKAKFGQPILPDTPVQLRLCLMGADSEQVGIEFSAILPDGRIAAHASLEADEER